MKLSILQNKIKEGINIVKNITAKSSSLPILNNILLQTEKSFLKLVATDLELGITWWILTKIEQEGKVVVPARIFSDFISFFPGKTIDLSAKNNILAVDAETNQTKIKGIDSENFPIIPKTEQEKYIVVTSFSFCQGLAQVIDFTASSTTRPEISGVYMSFQKNTIILASTDSFRLGEKKLKIVSVSPACKKEAVIIPQRTVREVINIFSEKEGEMRIYFGENQIMFERDLEETQHPQIQLVSKLIEGEYPQYLEIIPKKHKTEMVFEKDELLSHIKTASLFTGRINEIKLKVDPLKNQIEFFCQNPELGEHRSVLTGEIQGEEVEVSFNFRFLIDGLSNIKTSKVFFALSERKEGEEGPGVLKPVGDESYIYIAMPIQAS